MNKSAKLMITCMSDAWGGLEMVASELATEFHKNNYDVLFVCPKSSPLDAAFQKSDIKFRTLEPRAGLLKRILFFRKVIGEFGPDTILMNRLPTLKAVVPALIGRRDVRLMALSHMLIDYNKKDIYHSALYSRLNQLIVLTEHQRQNHLKFLPVSPEKMEIIPDWIHRPSDAPVERIDLKALFPEKNRHLPVSVIASRLDPQKGQDLAIKALGQARKKGRPFLLGILGENTRGGKDLRTDLLQLAEAEGVSNCIRFLGYHENIFPFLAAANNVLVPSKEETFGRVIIEAMSLGTPVVASNRGGPTCILEHMQSGMLFESENFVDLEQKIFEVHSNSVLHARLAKTALEHSKKYSKELVFQRLCQVVSPLQKPVAATQLNYLDT